jgi:hypothetical protein
MRLRINRAKWWKPWADWSCFWRFGNREAYWPSLITVWHVEPGGTDSFTVCKRSTRWQWHVHHWRVQFHPIQHFRRWALTRCEWCGGRSRKGDAVNVSKQWDRDGGHWWRGERGLFHGDCSAISTAHNVCVCGSGPYEYSLGGYAYGRCATCGLRRGWKSDADRHPAHPGEQANLLLRSIPAGHRDAAKTAQVRDWWAEWRAREDDPAVAADRSA